MSFQTPQHHGNSQSISLLFSPSPKGGDGTKQTSGLGRAPSITPGFGQPFTTTTTRDQTPPSRRRSVTPASSIAKETPPPPPAGSLLDSTSAFPPQAMAVGYASSISPHDRPHSHLRPEDMSTSPIAGVGTLFGGGGVFNASAQQQQQREYSLAERALREYDSSWVTVFGFGQSEVPLVLREFSKAGDIVQFIAEQPGSNWINIQYSNKHAAQRALLRNGDRLSSSCMVGVKGLDPEKIDALDKQSGTALGNGSFGTRALAVPKSNAHSSRPYHINAVQSQSAVVPLASKSAWEKVSEFILGL